MFQTILHVTGLDRKLETLKFEIEGKANQAISHIKAVGLQIAVATVFAVAAVIFTALAILAGFASLFVWLQPLYGTLPTIGIVAGALALIALVFMAIAVVVGKGDRNLSICRHPRVRPNRQGAILRRISRPTKRNQPPHHPHQRCLIPPSTLSGSLPKIREPGMSKSTT